jgi:hypothetical protein
MSEHGVVHLITFFKQIKNIVNFVEEFELWFSTKQRSALHKLLILLM